MSGCLQFISVFRRNFAFERKEPTAAYPATSVRSFLARRRPHIHVAFALLAAPAAMGAWALGLRATGNIAIVEPGEAYRSGQLTGRELAGLIERYGIRTVINLRGEHKGEPWYDEEASTSEMRGITHIDVRMSAHAQPTASTLDDLMSAMRAAPRPILIHCNGGADRTGLAAAIYELAIAQHGVDAARRHLSFRFGHFPWLGSTSSAMDRTFDELVADVTRAQHASRAE